MCAVRSWTCKTDYQIRNNTCRRAMIATCLMSEAQDRSLSLGEKLTLRLHLTMCSGCLNYDRQIAFLHKICQHHPAHPPSDKETSA